MAVIKKDPDALMRLMVEDFIANTLHIELKWGIDGLKVNRKGLVIIHKSTAFAECQLVYHEQPWPNRYHFSAIILFVAFCIVRLPHAEAIGSQPVDMSRPTNQPI